ncbi:MAG TPA: glycoside hydrolase family 3 N-terminal domain-containing protein [Verrucomicrobiae bacterium]|jgi:beta-glucosidase|nr:glycoside hydrolase family 3 N-terminal domain-containing protein [Verrucomicrobiae bacterium]
MKQRFLISTGLAVAACLAPLSNRAQSAESPDARADALLKQMTLEEKIGQMVQADCTALKDKTDVQKYFLGSVLSGGDSDPADNSVQSWLKMAMEFQELSLQTRLKIPIIYGVDAVHGHNNVLGAVIFPHNIGMGATHNAELSEAEGRVTAEELLGTGIRWGFDPCIAVAEDERWGRTYESYGTSPELAGELGAAQVRGLQAGEFSTPVSVLACAKHYMGDGGTHGGKDQGDDRCDEAALRKYYLPPYAAAVKANVGSIMVSYSSWNGKKMSANKYLLTDVLKNELGFKGFLVSDWAAIDQIYPTDYKKNVEASVNAGMDMVMIPKGPGSTNNYIDFINDLKALVAEGKVPMARIDDATRRILRIKYAMGIFEHHDVDPALTAAIGSAEHRNVARQCVRESLVLLKNSNHVLPLAKTIKHLHVAGQAADDLGMQCGGWTISWQGKTGAVTPGGTTILNAIRHTVSADTQVTFSADGKGAQGADAIVLVIGERPYAEMMGDRRDLSLTDSQKEILRNAKQAGVPVVAVLMSGRPLVLGSALDSADAFVAAWLPGTEGQGVADVLFGDYNFKGKLPRAWPRNNSQLDSLTLSDPLFAPGFGLAYANTEKTASASSGK